MDTKQLFYLAQRLTKEDYDLMLKMPIECQLAFIKERLTFNEYHYVKKHQVKHERYLRWADKNREIIKQRNREKARIKALEKLNQQVTDNLIYRPVRKWTRKDSIKPIDVIDKPVVITFD